jgi:tetratricopeptide (TPR) repeat protein
LSVDWNAFTSALQLSHSGNHVEAIMAFSALLSDCDSNSDRAAILLAQSSCHSRLGNIAKSRELLDAAKMCAVEDRGALSQVEMSEGSLFAQNDQYDLACEKFAHVKAEYADLLARPENDDFGLELDSRLACSLVEAGKYGEAIQVFRGLFKRDKLEDKQRLQLFFGVALLRDGKAPEAQRHLFEATTGNDPELAKSASDHLSGTGSSKQIV